VFGLDPETPAPTFSRTIIADREPVAVMRDVVRPGVRLPSEPTLRASIEAGCMVIDVLLDQGIAIAFAVTRVRPLLVSSRERVGHALAVQGTTAVLELEEIMHLGSGEAVQYSSDTFAPGGIDLQVRRNLDVAAPAPLVRAAGRV
jgi:DNA-binding GntR family transcriptional regulator